MLKIQSKADVNASSSICTWLSRYTFTCCLLV